MQSFLSFFVVWSFLFAAPAHAIFGWTLAEKKAECVKSCNSQNKIPTFSIQTGTCECRDKVVYKDCSDLCAHTHSCPSYMIPIPRTAGDSTDFSTCRCDCIEKAPPAPVAAPAPPVTPPPPPVPAAPSKPAPAAPPTTVAPTAPTASVPVGSPPPPPPPAAPPAPPSTGIIAPPPAVEKPGALAPLPPEKGAGTPMSDGSTLPPPPAPPEAPAAAAPACPKEFVAACEKQAGYKQLLAGGDKAKEKTTCTPNADCKTCNCQTDNGGESASSETVTPGFDCAPSDGRKPTDPWWYTSSSNCKCPSGYSMNKDAKSGACVLSKGYGGCSSDKIPAPNKEDRLVCECPWGFKMNSRLGCECDGYNADEAKTKARIMAMGGGIACVNEESCNGSDLGWNDSARKCVKKFTIEFDYKGIASKGKADSAYGGDHYYKAFTPEELKEFKQQQNDKKSAQ